MTIERRNEMLRLSLSDSSQHNARFVVLAVGNFPASGSGAVPPIVEPSLCQVRMVVRGVAWRHRFGFRIADRLRVDGYRPGGGAPRSRIQRLHLHAVTPRAASALHRLGQSWPTEWTADLPASVRPILAEVRQQIRLAADSGVDWRAVIDSIRPATQRVWKSLDVAERKRFLSARALFLGSPSPSTGAGDWAIAG